MGVSYRSPIRRSPGGGVVVDLDAVHAGAISEAVQQTRDLLVDSGADGGTVVDVSDPATSDEAEMSEEDTFAAIVAEIASPGDGRRPDDPVLRRLLPDASSDPDEATEFRVATEATLRRRKAAALDDVLEDLRHMREGRGPVIIGPDRVRSWLVGVNDTRLALGSVLEIEADDDLMAELDDYLDDGVMSASGENERTLRAYRIVVYDILTDILDKIVKTIS